MRVFVGMSGGVDSAVSAALLKAQGHDVTGVFIKTWHPDFLECTWREDRQDALRSAVTLGIPLLTCDLEDVYKRDVADYMIEEYRIGRTPNPDVMCNQHVKFGAFFQWALAQGADMIATGHYARVAGATREAPNTKHQIANKSKAQSPKFQTKLLAGVDQQKDQSYFLWTLSSEVLSRTLFPVGGMQKTEVRAYAHKAGLPVAAKKDSQGVCFLGDVDMKAFLKRFIDVVPGDVLDEQGTIIGTHDGALLYTLGERRGFAVKATTPHDSPRYVIAKDIERNTITVASSPRRVPAAQHATLFLEKMNWISGTPPDPSETLLYRFRYRQPLMSCRVENDGTRIVPEMPALHAAPGQSVVVYRGEECLGGGIIAQ